jgi:hypothetical protein
VARRGIMALPLIPWKIVLPPERCSVIVLKGVVAMSILAYHAHQSGHCAGLLELSVGNVTLR